MVKRTDDWPLIDPKKQGCWVIGCKEWHTEEHHVFFGTGQRQISEEHNFKAKLCPNHHRGQPKGVHGGNRPLDLALKKYCQSEFEKEYLRSDFMKLIGRNYLE